LEEGRVKDLEMKPIYPLLVAYIGYATMSPELKKFLAEHGQDPGDAIGQMAADASATAAHLGASFLIAASPSKR
jgi:hypothetical protein